jgi:hypothetical protein
MRRILFSGGLLISVLLGAYLIALFGFGSDSRHTDPSGTWYVQLEVGERGAIPEIVTFHQDGRYNFLAPGGSPGFGEWSKTGSHDVQAMALAFNVDQTTNKLTSVGQGRAVLHFNNNFDLFKGRLFAMQFKCDGPYDCPFPLTEKPYRKTTPDEGLPIKGMRLVAALGESDF